LKFGAAILRSYGLLVYFPCTRIPFLVQFGRDAFIFVSSLGLIQTHPAGTVFHSFFSVIQLGRTSFRLVVKLLS
jgi:hypothetical protein